MNLNGEKEKPVIFGGVGDYERGPFDRPVFELVEQTYKKYPDRIAISYLGKSWSFRELKDLQDRFATALHSLGLKHGSRLIIYIPNCPQFLIAFLGSQKIGVVPVPVSPIYTASELKYLINDSGAETILCFDTNFNYVEQVFPETCLKRIIVTGFVELLPWWKQAVGKLFDRIPDGIVKKDENVFFFKKLIEQHEPKPPKIDIDPRRDLSRILYTGGTTGFPKGVLTNHTAVVSGIIDAQEIVGNNLGEGGDENLILANPLFHEMGQLISVAWGLSRGNRVVIIPIPDVDAILYTIQEYKITLFLGVPTLYRMILENDRLDFYKYTSLKYCVSAADKLPDEIYHRWKDKFGIPIHQCYGATELGWTTASPFDKDPILGSVGLPLPSRKVLVLDSDTLEPVPSGEVGELFVYCEYTFKHYLNKPEETERAYVQIGDKIWYRTNDYVRIGEDGQIYFIDRNADTIKYKGYRVSASEIEAVLQNHPAVVAACVVGVPDERIGERIKAMVVLKEGVKGVSSADLLAFCRENLASYKIPKYIEFRDMLPKSKVGKLLRREVREEERRKVAKKKR